ncbi:MAG: SAM-dependent DNA methyltransferase [Acidimicrobiaceae bacterium]|nr:SAM-dependent DNA methyltransferase [Acidimicrobiaceae bacterium]
MGSSIGNADAPLSAVPISLSDLESYLGRASDLLRGAIDQADFKAYIFPLMFFKRISDVYLEEYEQALAESDGDHGFAKFSENHRFQIPDGCLWDDVRRRTENVGQALVSAMRGIERANPDTLFGIFGGASWTNKTKLPDRTLVDLIEHFSSKTLTNSNVAPDVFGQAYEYLIKRFADQSNKKAGEYYTPRSVVRLLVNILDPREGETVYDPACGTGGMLIEVIEHVKAAGGKPQLLWGKLFGQEKVLTTSSIARMNLLIHGVVDFKIVKDDTLRSPAFTHDDRLARFDCVIANPPFSLESWGEDQWPADKWGRSRLGGTPPRKYGDWAWVQHMVTSMAPLNGRIAVVVPQGALFRKAKEAPVRQAMIDADLIEAVIGLAPNLFYGTGLAAAVMILRARKPEEHRGKVLFINAESLYQRGRNQNSLEADQAARILELYRNFADVPGLSRVATNEEIGANDFSLNLPLYVAPVSGAPAVTMEESLRRLRVAYDQVRSSRAALEAQLAGWDL